MSFSNLARIRPASLDRGWAHVNDEAVTALEPEQLRSTLAEVGDGRINSARCLDPSRDHLPKRLVCQECGRRHSPPPRLRPNGLLRGGALLAPVH